MTKRRISFTKQFKKDYKRAKKQGQDVAELKKIVAKLASSELLDSKYRDHALSGKLAGYRELHIKPDWLLMYKIDDNEVSLLLARLGSHADILNM